MTRFFIAVAVAALALPFASPLGSALRAQSGLRHYVVDAKASRVDARVAFLGISSKTARFPDMTGALTLATDDPESIDLRVVVDARTLTTGDSQTKLLRGKQFFDVANHPTVTFTGKKMELTGDRTATVSGIMTARGVSRPKTMTIVFSAPPAETSGTDPLQVTGITTIDRREFGMKAFPLIVGNMVRVKIIARVVPG